MANRKLDTREILGRLQAIDALTADGWPLAEALTFVRTPPEDYEIWQVEYGPILRTLGPLASAAGPGAKARRLGPGRRAKPLR